MENWVKETNQYPLAGTKREWYEDQSGLPAREGGWDRRTQQVAETGRILM